MLYVYVKRMLPLFRAVVKFCSTKRLLVLSFKFYFFCGMQTLCKFIDCHYALDSAKVIAARYLLIVMNTYIATMTLTVSCMK